jgi:hypothetical protein
MIFFNYTIKEKKMTKTDNCTEIAISRLARVEVAGPAATAKATAAATAACEVGDPAASLVRVGSRAVRVSPAVVSPASSASVAGG